RALALKSGAKSFHLKPMSNKHLDELFKSIISFSEKKKNKVLLMDRDEQQRSHLISLLTNDNIQILPVPTLKKAVELLQKEDFDCLILDYEQGYTAEIASYLN